MTKIVIGSMENDKVLPEKKFELSKQFISLILGLIRTVDQDVLHPSSCGTAGHIVGAFTNLCAKGDEDMPFDLSDWTQEEKYVLVYMAATTAFMSFLEDDGQEKLLNRIIKGSTSQKDQEESEDEEDQENNTAMEDILKEFFSKD